MGGFNERLLNERVQCTTSKWEGSNFTVIVKYWLVQGTKYESDFTIKLKKIEGLWKIDIIVK